MKSWLQPPRLRIGKEDEAETRHETWLELFYDLVFVVAVSQVARNLSQEISWQGFLEFVVLFIPVWWAWIGTTFYANRFDSDDIGHRFLVGLQMLAIAALAVNVHHGLDTTSAGFALSYAAARIVLVIEYLRAGRHIPRARELTTHYAKGFAIAAALWLLSALVPPLPRFLFWSLGLVVDFATPLTARRLQVKLLPHTEHLPKRFGLFTIIVLGEAIIAVVSGVAEQSWNGMSTIAAIFGFSIAFSLWWLYFENIDGSALQSAETSGHVWAYHIWLYAHLPLVIGLAATGVGVEHVIAHEPGLALPNAERWLLCGSVTLYFLALGVLHHLGRIRRCKTRTRYRLSGAATLLIVAIAGVNLLPVAIIALVSVVCALQVGLDLYQESVTG